MVSYAVMVHGPGAAMSTLTAANTAGAFCLIEDHPPPGWALPTHWHQNEFETTCVIEGCFSC
jgi:uncharacterized cupin superfamily protein